jgi:Uma2 family endonuclease
MASPSKQAIIPLASYPEEYLPESDGRPMAETDLHRDQMVDLLDALKEYFRDAPMVYVSGNIFVYYLDEDNVRQSVSPDILVVAGVEKRERRVYKVDEEGKAPDFVIELTSTNTKLEDLNTKRMIYANLGVREYFLFDPYGEAIRPALRGLRLEGKDYVPMMGNRLRSEVLGLELRLEKGKLRLYDGKTGQYLLTHEEAEAARRAAESKAEAAEAKAKAAEAKAEAAEAKAKTASATAAAEASARQAAENELAQLREELGRLRGH